VLLGGIIYLIVRRNRAGPSQPTADVLPD
jgi:hypothetical protein